MKTSHKLILATLTFLASGVFVACGESNEEPGDEDPIVTPPGTGGIGAGGDNGTGGTTNGTGGGFEEPQRAPCPDAPDGVQPDTHPVAHRGTPCWNVAECNIVKPEQAKNQCNGSGCVPFSNTARIEGYTAGDPLPAL
jgi:hypothetical protein